MSDRQDAPSRQSPLHTSRRLSPLSISSNPSPTSPSDPAAIAAQEVRPETVVQAFEDWHHGFPLHQNAPPTIPEAPAIRRLSHSPSLQQSAYPTGSPVSTTPSASTSVASPSASHPLLRSYPSHPLDHPLDPSQHSQLLAGSDELFAQLAYPSLSRQGSSGLAWGADPNTLALLMDPSLAAEQRMEIAEGGQPMRTMSPGLGESNSGLPPFGAPPFPDTGQALDQDAPKLKVRKLPWQGFAEPKKGMLGGHEASGWGQEPLELAMNRSKPPALPEAGMGLPSSLHMSSAHAAERRALLAAQRKQAPLWSAAAAGGTGRLGGHMGGGGDAKGMGGGMAAGAAAWQGSAGLDLATGMDASMLGGEDLVASGMWTDPSQGGGLSGSLQGDAPMRLKSRLQGSRPGPGLLGPLAMDPLYSSGPQSPSFDLTAPDANFPLQHLDPALDPTHPSQARSHSFNTLPSSGYPHFPTLTQTPSSPPAVFDVSGGRRGAVTSPNPPPGLEYQVKKKPAAAPGSPPESTPQPGLRRKYKVPMVPVPQLVSRPDTGGSNPKAQLPARPMQSDLPPLYPSTLNPTFAPGHPQGSMLPSARQQALFTAPHPHPSLYASSQAVPTRLQPRLSAQQSLHGPPSSNTPQASQFFPQPSQSLALHTSQFPSRPATSPRNISVQRMRSLPPPDALAGPPPESSQLYRTASESLGSMPHPSSLYRTTSGGLAGRTLSPNLPRSQNPPLVSPNVSFIPWGEVNNDVRSSIEQRFGLSGSGARAAAPTSGTATQQLPSSSLPFRWPGTEAQGQGDGDVHMQDAADTHQQPQQQQRPRMQLVRQPSSDLRLLKREQDQ